MVHLNGSVERFAESVWLKLISRVLMPLLVMGLTIFSGLAFNYLKSMDARIDRNGGAIAANAQVIGHNASDIRNINTIRAVSTEPRLVILEKRVSQCRYRRRSQKRRNGR